MNQDHDDRAYFDDIRHGKTLALACVLERYWPAVVRYARVLLDGGDAAEDIAQEVFVRLWERRDAWQAEGSLKALLFRLTRNLAVDELRRRGAARRAAEAADPPPAPRTPQALLEEGEIGSAVARAVAALPERRREVFVLLRYHGLSYREAAEVLDLSPQTVANHLSLALADLRTALAPYHYASPREDERDRSA